MVREERYSVAGVANTGDRYFLAQRKAGTSIGTNWEFPGGKVKRREDFVDALRREYKEEFGIDINVGLKICEGSFENKGTKYNLLAFYIVHKVDQIHYHPEHQKIGWFTLDEIGELPLSESDTIIYEYLKG